MRRFAWLLMAVLLPQLAHARPAGTVVADVVALDQTIVYNRFGSFNPYGMVYALKRDVVDLDTGKTLDRPGVVGKPCRVALRADKRPRPLILRGNVGDRMEVNFTNLLCETAPGVPGNDPFAEVEPAEALIAQAEAVEPGAPPAGPEPVELPFNGFSRPATRIASMMFNGLTHDTAAPGYNTWDPRITGIAGIPPGASITYRLILEREGGHVFHDNGSPAGGEGDGGSTVLGLFGSVNVEPAGSNVYRSEVRGEVMAAARVNGVVNYEAVDNAQGTLTGTPGAPLLNMHKSLGGNRWALIHTDLNAVVQDFAVVRDAIESTNEGWFREFSSIFHDELKTVQAFGKEFDHLGAGAGLRDGFAINYGSSGLGAIVASNRLGVGPAASCPECALEDFFLTSWANGDPAMVVQYDENDRPKQLYPDDPGNVHHSYIGDPVKFRAMQAGVKETHVFHLHANQWFAKSGPGSDRSTYLDSQTLSPRQSLTYEIAYNGSNRNLSVGDAIYHCHMYPHFGQGMWALWRGHDVFEDGSRRLPDGELGRGTDPLTGLAQGGAYSPGVLPIRGMAQAPQPTYGATATPGFPFFVAGSPGHRPPQPPLDLVAESQLGPTGLGRHVVVQGERHLGAGVASADLSSELTKAELKLLPHDGTPLEKAAMAFHAKSNFATKRPDGSAALFKLNGKPAQPGAPFADPCPATAPVREYDVSVIQLDLVVNKAGWHDPQARINVLSSEVGDYEGRTRPANPFFFRAHSGDCIVFKHTNRVPAVLEKDDFQARTPTDTIGQHIHLVKFDVMASDGGGNGWNYEDGTFARDALRERVEAAHHFGTVKVVQADGSEVDLPADEVLPQAANIGYQTSIQRWWADEVFDRAGADQTLRTVFTHDHFGASSIQQHGFYNALVIEPKGTEWLAADGSPLQGGVGPEAIIKGADDAKTHPDYREFLLASADFSLLYTSTGEPVDPPARPEAISAGHHNPYLVNYKNEPIPLRLSAKGTAASMHTDKRADPAYAFSSTVHGDPFTPVLKAYEGERVQLRLIHGAQEVQQVFTLHGHRWRREIGDKTSTWVGAQELGISEHFEISTGRLPKVSAAEGTRDYLFHYGTTDALWNGAWGILRAFDKPNSVDPVTRQVINHALKPLDEVVSQDALNRARHVQANLAANSCPINAKQRAYDVQVWAARDLLPGGALVYNKRAGLIDPTALMYVHASDVAALRSGQKAPEPFVMRANAGECIVVRLSNRLPANLPVPDLPGDARLPNMVSMNADDVKPSRQVGMHATLVSFDPRNSDGANVGHNPEQLAAPGQTRTYVWYAGRIKAEDAVLGSLDIGQPIEFGTIPLRAMGDVVKHGAQGLIGALIIEPANSTWWNAANTSQVGAASSTAATIRVGTQSFKEFVLHYQDGLNLRKKDAQGSREIQQHWVGDDSYDMGERALNYRTEPLWSRIDYEHQDRGGLCTEAIVLAGDISPCVLSPSLMVDNDPRIANGFPHGLPVETPVFEAQTGDAVRFRVLQADGRARQHSFRVIGHNYADQGMDGFLATGASLIAPGKAVTANLYGGAKRGYWHYRDGPTPFVNTGVWGLFKVSDKK